MTKYIILLCIFAVKTSQYCFERVPNDDDGSSQVVVCAAGWVKDIECVCVRIIIGIICVCILCVCVCVRAFSTALID